jgi:hypothetical protein
MINFNTEPYNDDYSEDSKFYRILFRPAFAVQARELTQLQTILQNQVTRQGNHLFKEGAMVIPGQVSIDTKAQYVKLLPSYNSVITETFIQNCEGKFITGGSNGVKAQIVKVVSSTVTDPTTLYVRYLSSGTDGVDKVFLAGEIINFDDGTDSVQAISSSSPTGTGSTASIQRGIYYVNGFFVLCADPITGGTQTIVLSKYSSTPSYRIGLNILEAVIVPEDDETLLDNAQTSYNYAAPGAHRYHIDLILAKKNLDDEDDQGFIELLRVGDGAIQRIVTHTEYSELEKTFARRTYDESGNYDVRPFTIDVREARTNDRGVWTTTSTAYLIGDIVSNAGKYYTAKNTGNSASSVAPTHTSGTAYDGNGNTGINWEYTVNPVYNRGISLTGSDDQLAIALDPGKAYVQGYEIEKVATEYVYIDKCRGADHTVQVDNATIPATVGNYIIVNTIQGCPPVDTFATVGLYNRITQEPAATLTGTLSVSSGGTALTGSGSAFTTELIIGSRIYNSSGLYIGTVTAIASDTAATITAAAAALSSATSNKKGGRGIAATSYTYGTAGVKVGTARIRAIEWHSGTIGTDACQYKLMLFDIKMNAGYDFTQHVKSIYYDNSAGGFKVDFTADIEPVTTRLIGAATASSTTVTGNGTSFLTDLVVGDYINLGTTIRRVTAIASQVSLTVDASVTVTGVTIDRITTLIKEPQNETLLFRFPYYAIKSATGADNTKQITYYTYQKLGPTAASSGAGGYCTVGLSGVGTLASAAETDNYQVIDYTTGKTLLVDSSAINVAGSGVTITLVDTYAGRNIVVIATSKKTLSVSTEKSKTLRFDTTLYPECVIKYTTQAAVNNPTLSLGVADAYRIVSVKQATGFAFGSSPTDADYVDDVSDHYDFNDGQTASYYGLSTLTLKSSYSPPNAPVRVQFEYFAHGSGDYFTVNSYTDIDYKKIPHFGSVPLRDCIDFRPRVDTTGTAFTGSGGATSLVLKRGYDIEADFSYYLARSDKIALDFNGSFFSITGVPSLNPGLPSDPTLGMVLYDLNLEPYTFTTAAGSVNVVKHDNKRYTMRDIGRLEKRIDTLEYYTSLSMLEQETQSLEITDSATGLNRFKNGFIVDNFAGHATGDTLSPDYFCSIDMEKNELRPFYSMKNINLIEKETTDSNRFAANYQLTGDMITLPIIDQPALVTQPYASRLENINPFAIFTFLGNINLTPSSDEWFETDRRPDVIQNVEGDFNTISTLAEKAGVLGTVWNAWQTQWTGVPVSAGVRTYVADQRGLGTVGWRDGLAADTDASTLNAMFGNVQGEGWAHRVVTTETFASQVGQTRTGINTQVVARIDKRQVDDKVLSTAVIPYIRSRNILIQAAGLKPSTKFNPFFDKVDVSDYCTPATKMTIVVESDTFDITTNVGGDATLDPRRINGDTQVCLNKGDVITGSESGATAIIVGSDKTFNASGVVTGKAIYVVNIRGTFQAETIVGSISGAVGRILDPGSVWSAGQSLITNQNGEVQFLFNIPQNDSLRFRSGQRELVLTDADTASNMNYTSRGKNNYYAQGILETKQATFTATRNGQIVSEQVAGNQTVIQTSERVVSDTGWYDPLAQTFQVKSQGGAFLTKVDVFFASKDLNIPVTLEIREVINGYPGKLVLPFSRVTLKPENVNISTNEVDLPDGTKAKSYDTPTTFTFPSPVYVQDNGEYALVLASDSNGYKVWVSNLGDKIPNSSRTISEQPYAGVLFKSQNGSTWTANQDQDLKFTIYRAKFPTITDNPLNVAAVEFINDVLPTQTLDKDPFETNTGSAKLKVYQNNHGLSPGSYVTISNTDNTKINGVAASAGTITCSTGTTTVSGSSTVFETDIGTGTIGKGTVLRRASDNAYIGIVASVGGQTTLTLTANAAINIVSGVAFKIVDSINGIPSTEVYKSQSVAVVVENDSYIVNCTNTATNVGYSGGTTVTANQNAVYNAIQPIIQSQSFSETTALFSIKTRSGQSINGSETAYTAIPAGANDWDGIIPNETNYFSTPRLIASEQNQNSLMSGNPSATLLCQMSTTNDALSPVIDTHRISLIAISNTINAPTETNTNNAGIDEISLITANTTIGFTAETTTGAANATMYSLDNTDSGLGAVGIGKTLQTIKVGKYVTISGAAVNAANKGTFLVTKVVSNGTTTTVTLKTTGYTAGASAATTVVLRNHFVDEIAPVGGFSHSKYVTKKISLATPASTLKIKLAANIPSSANVLVYYRTSPVGTKDAYSTLNYTLVTPDVAITKVGYGNGKFSDLDYTLTDLTSFDAFTVKIVLQSTNSSEIPKVKDLRVVACS